MTLLNSVLALDIGWGSTLAIKTIIILAIVFEIVLSRWKEGWQ